MSSLPYRPCVGIALFNDKGQVFVGERIDSPGAWQMPQGGIDPGEDITTAAMRELGEEVGTQKAVIIEISDEKLRYEFPPDLPNTYLRENFRGQEQTWVALRFTGTPADINLAAHDPAEFQAWQWVELDRITDLIVPFKRDLYRQVIAKFQKYASGV